MADERMIRCKGAVTKFNDQKGYGFIRPEKGGEDLFVHQTSIKSDGYRTLREGQLVEFTITFDAGKTKAVDVTAPGGGPLDTMSRRGGGSFGFSDRSNNIGGGGGGGCYSCGGYGHMARDCPTGGRGRGGGGSGMMRGNGACFTCGEVGHIARDCVGGGSGGFGGGYSRGGGVGYGRFGGGGGGGVVGGGGKCFNCGESGHFARDCKETRRS